jgi:ABC-type bacteriocin/lantibiotic exporter with double-glycine peptidase domain
MARLAQHVILRIKNLFRPAGGAGALLAAFGREFRGLLCLALLLGVLEMLSQMTYPWLMQYLVDRVILPRRLERLPLILGLFLGSAILTVIIRTCDRHVLARTVTQISSRVRLAIARHTKRVPLQVISTRRSGELVSLSVSDVPVMTSFYDSVLIAGALNVIRLATILGVVVIWFNRLAYIAIASLPLYVLIPIVLSRRLKGASERVQQQQAVLSAELHESIASTRDIRVHGREQWDLDRLRGTLAVLTESQMSMSRWRSVSAVTFALYWVVCGATYWVGAHQVAAGTLTLGALLAAISFISVLEVPVSALVGLNSQWHSAQAAARRVAAFLDIPVEHAAASGHLDVPTCAQGIVFDQVWLEYSPGMPVVRNLSLSIPAGRRVAIVGQSGSGKTSIIGLLLRLYQPIQGRILIDGLDVSQVRIESLRRCIGVAFQDSFLFGGTIADNVRLGKPESTDEEVTRALQAVGAMDWIGTLPSGIHAPVGDRGAILSGGQRQRVVLARAFVSRPSVMILDEATSMLDSQSEQTIFEAFARHMPETTVVIVAHRLSAVLAAELVILLQAGEFVSSGSHASLMRGCPTYQQLVAQQLSSAEPEEVAR